MLFENIYKEKFGDGAFLDIDLVQQSGLGVKCISNSNGEDAKVVIKPIYYTLHKPCTLFPQNSKKSPFLNDNTNIPHPRSSILINQ